MKELLADVVREIKALKKASMMLKPQIAEKAVIKAAQTMEAMINEIEALQERVKELEAND